MTASAPRILVTGAGGFVGSLLVRQLAAKLPAGSALFAAGHEGDGGTIMPLALDVTDGKAVEDAVRAVAPSRVMHLAAISSFHLARQNPRRAWDVNLYGTLNLADALLKHAPDATLVFAGTSEAYGEAFNHSAMPLDEHAPLLPRSLYAATKAAADLALGQMAHDGLKTVRFRPFNHTGPGQGADFVVPAFAAQIARIEAGLAPPVIHVGNLDARRDFLDVRDVIAAYETVLLGQGFPSGAVFNLSSGKPRRIGDVLDGLLALSNVEIEVRVDPARLRPNEVPVVAGSSALAREALGWEPKIAWHRTLADVLDGCREQVASERS